MVVGQTEFILVQVVIRDELIDLTKVNICCGLKEVVQIANSTTLRVVKVGSIILVIEGERKVLIEDGAEIRVIRHLSCDWVSWGVE